MVKTSEVALWILIIVVALMLLWMIFDFINEPSGASHVMVSTPNATADTITRPNTTYFIRSKVPDFVLNVRGPFITGTNIWVKNESPYPATVTGLNMDIQGNNIVDPGVYAIFLTTDLGLTRMDA